MNNDDRVPMSELGAEPGSEPLPNVANPSVSVYCTRPPEPGYSYPHENQVDAAVLLDAEQRRNCRCAQCGMPLVLDNRYVPISKLSQGGFSITFLARDLQALGRGTIAPEKINGAKLRVIKLFHPATTIGFVKSYYADLKQYFEDEARVLFDLDHPQIPRIIGYFEVLTPINYREQTQSSTTSADNNLIYLYIVQEYIDGSNLDGELQRQGKFSEPQIRTLLKQVLGVFNYIHDRQIIHRDIHPGNLILCNDKYYLIDFGTVKERVQEEISAIEDPDSAISLGNLIGRPGYVDPSRSSYRRVTRSADLYSLAAVCVHLLTGEKPTRFTTIPFRSREALNESNESLAHDWKPLAGISSALANLLERMLAVEPAERPPSAAVVLQELDDLERQEQAAREQAAREQAAREQAVQAQAAQAAATPRSAQRSPQRSAQATAERSAQATAERSAQATTVTKKRNALWLGACVGLLAVAGLAIGTGKLAVPLLSTNAPIDHPADSAADRTSPAADSPLPAADLISAGGQSIADSMSVLEGSYATLKQEGMSAFQQGDYATAAAKFTAIRATANQAWASSNLSPAEKLKTDYGKALQDPTVLIYQNNAIARQRAQAGQPIYRVAAAVPLNYNIGQQMLFGIAQAQDLAVNRSEQPINLEIVIANDRNKSSQSTTIAQAIVNDQWEGRSILAVIGHYLSLNTCAALRSAYVPAEIPVVSPLSTAANIRQAPDCQGGAWFFRTTSSTNVEATTLVNYLIQQQPGARVAVFYNPKDFFSNDLYQEFLIALRAKGGRVIETIDLANPIDATATLDRLNNEVDALAVLADGRLETAVSFERAIDVIKANQGNQLVLGSNPLYDLSVINGAGLTNVANKLFVATDWHRQCVPSGAGTFVNQAENRYWFGTVNRTAALSYEAVQVILSTLTPDVSRDQIRQRLQDTPTKPVTSDVFANKTISFNENGDRRELQTRILTTPRGATFEPVAGCLD